MTIPFNNLNPEPEIINSIIADAKVRKSVITKSHFWFFNVYFSHYVSYPTAQFQKEMFDLTQNEINKFLVIVAFRGSGKTTIMGLSYPIWSIIGKPQKKYILILSKTMDQSKQILKNIKDELERNTLLKYDLGPFQEENEEWRSVSLVLPQYGARITAASMEQSIRGIRHGQHRPDLIIIDDVEDLNSVKTKESRDNTYNWVTGDIVPLGDKTTQIVIVGNLLHDDSLIMKYKKLIEDNKLNGIFKAYPLFNGNDEILWPGKFANAEDIESERKKIGNEIAWQREYLLRIIPDDCRVIHQDWIKYYDALPPTKRNEDFRYTATGIDLAISQKESADYTAMVSANVYGYQEKINIYILPNPVNQKLTHNETLETAKSLSISLGNGYKTKLYVEDVGYQKAVVQELKRFDFPAEEVPLHGQDKRARLALTSHLVQNGTVVFPKHGAEQLISQLTNFGTEKHDDLADAFSILILKIIEKESHYAKVGIIFF